MDGGALPGKMGMPPEGAPLASNGELVCIGVAFCNGALSDISRTISPSCSQLLYSMPAVDLSTG